MERLALNYGVDSKFQAVVSKEASPRPDQDTEFIRKNLRPELLKA